MEGRGKGRGGKGEEGRGRRGEGRGGKGRAGEVMEREKGMGHKGRENERGGKEKGKRIAPAATASPSHQRFHNQRLIHITHCCIVQYITHHPT